MDIHKKTKFQEHEIVRSNLVTDKKQPFFKIVALDRSTNPFSNTEQPKRWWCFPVSSKDAYFNVLRSESALVHVERDSTDDY